MPMTTHEIVKKIVLLRRLRGKVLLPTPEVDLQRYFNKVTICHDLENYPIDYKFNSVVGVLAEFIHADKCLDHLDRLGELIVCSPNGFLNSPLNRKLYELGTVSDVINVGDDQIVWRFVKDDFTRKTLVNGDWKNSTLINDKIAFLDREYVVPFTSLFMIRVGAISGLDEAFVNKKGNADFVTSQTAQGGETKKMFFNLFDKSMLKYKQKLLARKVKKFNEDNWWAWGRSHHVSDQPRVYVPCKTKRSSPFFHHKSIHYDGTVLAVFFKGRAKPSKIVSLLNKVDWEALGFKTGKRFVFSQKSLESINLPREFSSIYT